MNPALIIGGAALLAGITLSRRSVSGGLYGLGDEPRRDAFLRTHIAKKFWGTSVLMSQGAESMRKLSARVRSTDTAAADDADRLSKYLDQSSKQAIEAAQEYDSSWVSRRMARVQ